MRPPRCAGMISPAEGERLASLAASIEPSRAIVELGTHTGLSTCWMAAAAKAGHGAHITAVDPWAGPRPGSDDDPLGLGDTVYERFSENVTAEGHWGAITPLKARSTVVAESWIQPIGLLFIDAVHEYEHVRDDYQAWERFIPSGGWVAFHDYNPDPAHRYFGVAQAIAEFVIGWSEPVVTGSLWTARRP